MKNIKRFWKRITRSLNPSSYSELSDKSVKRTIAFIAMLLFVVFVIMGIIAIPKLLLFPDKLGAEMSKFETFKISTDIKMSSPIILTEQDPQIIIDTTGQTQLTNEKLLLTKKAIYYKPIKEVKSINTSIFADVAANKDEIANIIAFIAIFALPALIVAGFLIFFVKYMLLILIAAGLAHTLVELTKYKIGFARIFNITAHAATPMIIIEVLWIPFNSKYLLPLFSLFGVTFYGVTLIIFVVFITLGVVFGYHKKFKKESHPDKDFIEWGF